VIRAALLALVLLSGCSSAESLTVEGDRLLRENDLIGAEKAYERALQRDPHYAPAIYGKGWALYASGFDELRSPARQLFQRAIDYGPDFFGGYRGLGVLFLADGKVGPGERYLRDAYNRAPADPGVLESLGQLYLRAGKLSEARTLFQGAVDAAPNRGEFHRFLADVAIAERQWDEAFAAIDRGRASVVSGLRGTMALDEGEARIRLEFAGYVAETALGADDPNLALALQGLTRADELLAKARSEGRDEEEFEARTRYHEELRRRLEDASTPSTGKVRKKVTP
jgi:tetratricopeptide (TPR) repeat protein